MTCLRAIQGEMARDRGGARPPEGLAWFATPAREPAPHHDDGGLRSTEFVILRSEHFASVAKDARPGNEKGRLLRAALSVS